MDDVRLERIASRIANTIRSSSNYEHDLDEYINKLDDAKKLLETIHENTRSAPGKAIVMGMHSDLLNFIADRDGGVRKWVEQLKFMSRSKSERSPE